MSGGEARDAELRRGTAPSVAILGSGPNRIGQGIEFDYCCVHAAMTVQGERARRGDDQLQPGDGLDRLRHLHAAVLRAADRRGRARGGRRGAPGGRDRAVRRPDAAADRGGPAGGGRARCSARRWTRSTWPRTAAASAALLDELGHPGAALRRRARPRARRSRWRGRIGFPLLVRPSYVLGGRAMELCYSEAGPGALPRAPRGRGRGPHVPAAARPLPRERDRARRGRARRRRGRLRRRASCSTSRRPGCTPATPPACCRR